jgi:ADP-ribose pyrophosphatase YjhB (NUDIX family)
MGVEFWAPPGGGVEPGESPTDTIVRELEEDVGYRTNASQVLHVWHQVVVSSTYSTHWDGAIHDYFLVRCPSFTASGLWTAKQLATQEGITTFRWWPIGELVHSAETEEFRPVNLPNLLNSLLKADAESFPVSI